MSLLQGQDIVVVIGMLHCNGVARWLLSGVDPMTFNYSAEVQKWSKLPTLIE